MVPDTIPATNAPVTDASGDCPIRKEIALLAASLDARFLRAGNTLATAVETIDRIIRGLDGIAAALDERTAGAAVTDLRSVADELTGLPDRQAGRGGRMAAVEGIAHALNEHVLDMHKTLRILSIYGMNIKIAASGEDQFVGFVNGMTVKLGVGEKELAGIIVQLKSLMDAVSSALQADRLLTAESGKVIPAIPIRLAGDAGDLARHLDAMAQLTHQVAAIARSVQGKVAVVLGALQVGDSTRQRLEHAVATLQLVETHARDHGADVAVAGHVDRLVAAQIDAAADFAQGATAMLASLADLAPDTMRVLDLVTEQGEGGGRTVLSRLDQGISDVEQVTARLRDAETRSKAMVDIITDTVAELSRRLSGVRRIQIDVQDIATNTRLLCRRHGATGKAVAVIATEVDIHASGLGATTARVAQAIGALGEIEASLRAAGHDDRDMGETLARALAIVRRACQRSEEVSVEGGDDARQLIDLLADAGDELGRELAITGTLDAAARTLERRTPATDLTVAATATLGTLLPAIARLYTMADERDVHAAFLLPGMDIPAPPPPPPVADDDDDDDGLF